MDDYRLYNQFCELMLFIYLLLKTGLFRQINLPFAIELAVVTLLLKGMLLFHAA